MLVAGTTYGDGMPAADASRADYFARAHAWLNSRPGRVMNWPDDVTAMVAAVGVPCGDCGETVNNPADGVHTVRTRPGTGTHWADAVTVACGRTTEPAPKTTTSAPKKAARSRRTAPEPPAEPAPAAKTPARRRAPAATFTAAG
jgi:hypothetical protein